jgi:hypothetical protein
LTDFCSIISVALEIPTFSGEGGEEENATKELLHMTTLIQTAMDYVSSLKKGQVIQVGYKDGLKYGCRVQQVKLFFFNALFIDLLLLR